jgi:hypothetical protein
LLRGLELHAQTLRRRADQGLDASGFTAHERAYDNVEKRRKAKMKRLSAEGRGYAAADIAPASAQCERIQCEPGVWLAAPLAQRDERALDWEYMERAVLLMETTTASGEPAWPSLFDRAHPLVQQREEVRVASGGGGGGGGGGVAWHMEMCALASYGLEASERAYTHANVLSGVTWHADGSVSGELEKRGVNVSFVAVRTRIAPGHAHAVLHPLVGHAHDALHPGTRMTHCTRW